MLTFFQKVTVYFLSIFFLMITLGSSLAISQIYIYMTFDDGPLQGTEEIIQVIDDLDLPISMMMVGLHVEASPANRALLRQADTDPRILVGNHSYSHAYNHYLRFYQDPQKVFEDFEKNQTLLNTFKKQPLLKIARLPGRNMWQVASRARYDVKSGQSSARLLHQNGYTLFGWDVEWAHNARTGEPIQSVDEMVRLIEAKAPHAFTPNHVVVLAHDEMFRTSQEDSQLRRLIQKLKQKGSVFRTLKEYPLEEGSKG